MVQGGMSVVKFLLFVFNFVFVVCGIALIVVGAIAQSSGKEYAVVLGSKFVTAPIIFIVVGCIIFLVAFFGCSGALKQNYCMVVTFAILLFLIFIVEIACGIAAYVYRKDLDRIANENMYDSLKQYNKTDAKTFWDEFQAELKCCGVNSSQDYPDNHFPIPHSCCGKEVSEDPCTKPYSKGCYGEFKSEIEDKVGMIGAAGIAIALIEILGIVFAWCLASAIKKEYEGV